MNKKLQVFVSSTYTDLIEERQAAVEAILDAGHIPAGMELFKAGKSQMKTIQKWIDESDVYMLILGGRYGSIEEESGLSYTELEYRYALSKNMPVFAIVLDDSFLFTKASSKGKNAIFEKDNIDKYELFKKCVKTNIVKFAQNINMISLAVLSQLNYFLNDSEYNLCGWVKNSKQNTHLSKSYSTKMSVLAIMPFSEEWSQDVYSIIKKACIESDVKLINTEEINMTNSRFIYTETFTYIKESDIIIADVTVKDANVFYELGFAYGLDKHVILIRQQNCYVPFDAAKIRYLTYELSPSKAKEFQKYLAETINLYKE